MKKADGKIDRKMVDFCYDKKNSTYQQPISKMNIPLNISQVNFKKNLPQEIQVFSQEELQQFGQGAIIKKQKEYYMVIHHRQFTIQCPILRMDDGSYQIIWPSFKLPNRPYPVYVYLYAAAWYLSTGESMRAAAQKAMRVFGLETFSHSTICRFLQKIYQVLPYLICLGAQIINDWGIATSAVIRRRHWDEVQHKKARDLYGLINPALRSPPEFGNWLAYEFWQDTNNFIA